MRKERDLACAWLFRSQYGLIHRLQAIALGMSDQAIQRRVAAGVWEEVLPGVYRLAGFPDSWLQRLKAAAMWAGEGCAISHRAAAALFDLDLHPRGIVELTMRTSTAPPRPDVIVHNSNRLRDVDVIEHRGIAVTTVPRTLLDLGAVQRPWRVYAAADHALRDGRTSEDELREHLNDLGGRGCRGTGPLRGYLKDLTALGSVLERRTALLLRKNSIAKPHTQYELFDEDGLVGALDFAWPRIRLGLEADGYKPHQKRQSFYADRTKMNRAAALRWTVLRSTWWDIEHPGQLVRILSSFFA